MCSNTDINVKQEWKQIITTKSTLTCTHHIYKMEDEPEGFRDLFLLKNQSFRNSLIVLQELLVSNHQKNQHCKTKFDKVIIKKKIYIILILAGILLPVRCSSKFQTRWYLTNFFKNEFHNFNTSFFDCIQCAIRYIYAFLF